MGKVGVYLIEKPTMTFRAGASCPFVILGPLWVATKLNYPIRMTQVDGPPVGALSRELTNIKEGGVRDSLFEIPGDYREIKKPVQDFCGAGVCTGSFY